MNSLKSVSLSGVDITGGFWKKRAEINRKTTIYRVYERFAQTGRFDALTLSWRAGMENKPHIFWDSDIAKWMEGAAYIIEKDGDERLEKLCDDTIDTIVKGQAPDGYFNSYFQTCEPDARFTRRVDHELYCCGHFVEAAVAYYNATGKRKLLDAMCRYVDLVEKVFKTEHSAPYFTPGHEEIELALVKLYHCTGEKKYLDLSKYFVDERGRHQESSYQQSSIYELQDQLPVREMTTAEGHAVRAGYLYSAMADIAREYADDEMLAACKRIFENISKKRMYITGGIGSSKIGEAFTLDYDLPNKTSYTETCAAISLAMFAHRMTSCELDSKYGDIFERVIYNAFPAGVSLDGDSFYYSDPMEISPRLAKRNVSRPTAQSEFPKLTRSKVFDCSCCPPNITRFTADMGEYIYFYDDNRVVVDQFIENNAEIGTDGKTTKIEMKTSYPENGTVNIKATGLNGKSLFIRIPGWCDKYSVKLSDKDASYVREKNGYLKIGSADEELFVTFEMEMPVVFVEADPRVEESAGKLAVMRGPVVYCSESVDNGSDIHGIYVDANNAEPEVVSDSEMLNTITVKGFRKTAPEGELYFNRAKASFTAEKIKLIPYYCMENRGESEMCVWLNVRTVK